MRTVAIAGSTGSIGTQTLDVVAAEPDRYEVVALGATGRNLDLLAEQVDAVRPKVVAIWPTRPGTSPPPPSACPASSCGRARRPGQPRGRGRRLRQRGGRLRRPPEVTLAALEAGRRLALANKESLIAGGPVVQRARRHPRRRAGPGRQRARRHPPVPPVPRERVRPGCTAGAHRQWRPVPGSQRKADLAGVTVDDALAHPTWSDGSQDHRRLVDAHEQGPRGHRGPRAVRAGVHGVGIGFDQIDVVVHPQSMVHSMVTYTDGSTIAQLSMPDMRLPIGPTPWPGPIGWAHRLVTSTGPAWLAWTSSRPDLDAFPVPRVWPTPPVGPGVRRQRG
jgi:1-deoxy-D-xylulose-5-phosphate reductoisomerase